MTINQLIDEIKDNVEYLWTTELEDEVECISMENLQGILQKFLGVQLKLTNDE